MGRLTRFRSPRFRSKSASFQSIVVGGPAAAEFQDERGCVDSGMFVGFASRRWVNGFKMDEASFGVLLLLGYSLCRLSNWL